jgi:serine protease Do
MKRLCLTLLMVVVLAAAAGVAAQQIPPEAETHYLAAREALLANDVDKALGEINKSVELAPQNFMPYVLRGRIYLGRQETDKAEADFTRAISLKADYPEAYTLRARALQAQDRLDQAVNDLNRALSLDANDKEALSTRAYVYYQMKKFEGARADVARAQKLGVKFPEDFVQALEKSIKDRPAPIPVRGRPAEEPAPARPVAQAPPLPAPPTPGEIARSLPPERPLSTVLPDAVSSAPDMVTLIKSVIPAVVTILGYNEDGKLSSSGSGFFITPQGQLITNYHVIRSMTHAKIKDHQGRTYPMITVLAVNKKGDLAMCQVDVPGVTFPHLTVTPKIPEVGERVLAIGSPFLLELTVSDGMVSAIRGDTHLGPAIQMTAPISPGSSGGPVVNLKGEVVGVSTFYREGGQNLNFAIAGPSVLALKPGPAKNLAEVYSPPELEKAQKLYDYGRQLYAAKDYQKALQAFREAVSLNPKFASAYNYLGLIYRNLGRYEDAAKAYVRAIQLQPQNYVYIFNLGMLMYTAKAYKHAVTAFVKAIEIRPEDVDSHFMLGKTYVKMKNYPASLREYAILQQLDAKQAAELYRFIYH